MKRKLISVLLVVSIVLTFIPITSFAKTYGGEFDSLTKDPNGTPYTCNWIFDEASATLYIEGVGVLAEQTVGNFPWEKYRDKVVNLVVEEGITLIGKRGFASHGKLKTVSLPESLTAINMRAFEYCRALEEITVPGNVNNIQDQAFLECSSLKRVYFEDGIENIGCYMFGNCKALEEVYVYGKDTKISRMRSNNDDGVWFRGITDFSKLTAYCYEGSDAADYFENDIYTITNWANDKEGNRKQQSFDEKPNYMTAGGYSLKVEYITE